MARVAVEEIDSRLASSIETIPGDTAIGVVMGSRLSPGEIGRSSSASISHSEDEVGHLFGGKP